MYNTRAIKRAGGLNIR